MRKPWLLSVVFLLAALADTPAFAAANALSQSANGIAFAPSKNDIAINAVSEGRACGKIFYNNLTLLVQDPGAACNLVNGPIPPNRVINFTDGAGNMVAAKAIKVAPLPGFFKAYFTRASTKFVNAGTFAEAEFRDPIMFFDPLGEAFDVDVTRAFLPIFDSDEGVTLDGLHLGGSSGSDSAQFHASMSSNLTGFLFSLSLTYTADQPLGVDVTLGAVSGQLGWDELALESTLRALLDASNADNDFSLSSFSFPNIRIHVGAGESLELFTSDVSTAQAPEPAMVWLFALGVLAFALASRVGPRRFLLSGLWLLALVLIGTPGVEARPVSGEPKPCPNCECPPCFSSYADAASGSSLSYTEGNLSESYSAGETVSSASGATLRFGATYNSKQADGSQSRSDSVMGYGWTHSYNTMLFSQRGHMFRLGADGRVTKYALGAGAKYTVTAGYFETLVKNPDGSFTLRQKDGTTYKFAQVPGTPFYAEGPVWRLQSITDRNNNVTTFTYLAGKLTGVTDTYGRKLTFSYTGNLLTGVADPLNRVTSFSYSANTLVQVTDPEGKTVQYSYNALAQLTRKVDKDGRVFTYQYNGAQKPVGIRDGAGNPILTLSNPNNWATNETVLALSLMRVYLPSTTSRTDGRGNVWTYQYDQNGYVTRMTAPDGAVTRYTYDAATLQVASQIDANNRTTSYQYDAQGNMLKRTDALGFITIYTYEPTFNMMTSMTDANGRVTTYSYDEIPNRGNRTKETDPLLGFRLWTYYDNASNCRGHVRTESDKKLNVTTYDVDAFCNRIKVTEATGTLDERVTTYQYDAVGNVRFRTDANNHVTEYQYDGLNRLKAQVDAANKTTEFFYDGQGNRVKVIDREFHPTVYQYDLRQRLMSTIDALIQTSSQAYDGNNNRISLTDRNNHTTSIEYDLQNRPKRVTDALLPVHNVSTMTYDPVGNLLSETDANGHTTTYTYDELNRRTTRTDAELNVTRMFYDMVGVAVCPECTGPTKGSRLVTKQIDPEGKLTYLKYDGLDRLIIRVRKQTDAADVVVGDPDDAVTRYSYDAQSNRVKATEPNGNVTSYDHDALNRQKKIAVKVDAGTDDITVFTYDSVGNVKTVTAPSGNVTIYSDYDALDRLLRVDDSEGLVATYTYDNEGNQLAQKDGNGNGVDNEYDAIYRLGKVTDALGKPTKYDYDPVGNLLQITDREGNVTSYTYDEINRRTSMTEATGKPEQRVTNYEYDAVGNLTRIIDANGHATDYAYDNINRRLKETYADGRMRTYTYDRVSNLKTRTDQKAQLTTYTYSDLHFLTKRVYPLSPADIMTYDLSGRMLSAERGGWLVSFSYDGANRVTQTKQNGKTLDYVHNIPGRTRTLTYPGGRTITESTDARSRLGSIDDGGLPPPIVQYSYDAGNRVLTRDFRNGTQAAYSYNDNNWILGLDHAKAGVRIAGFNHAYDNEGNKHFEEKLTDAAASQGKSEAYQYDSLYRLIDYKVGALSGSTVPLPSTQTQYDLDPVGNWNKKTKDAIPEPRTHSVTNEITLIGGGPVLSDFNGNTNEDGQYRYNYDEENRLIRVSRKSDQRVVGRYEYDALSRRVKKVANPPAVSSPVETRYFYDDARIVEEQTPLGATQATYVYGNYIDEILTMDRAAQTYYYHQNSLWSVEAVTDAAGAAVERYAYDAYGMPTIMDGAGAVLPLNPWSTPHSAIGNPWMFTGRQFDEESGIYFYRARYHDPGKGRFLQRDPLGYVDGMNLYEYVKDNPTNLLDPAGEKECCATQTPNIPVHDPATGTGCTEAGALQTALDASGFLNCGKPNRPGCDGDCESSTEKCLVTATSPSNKSCKPVRMSTCVGGSGFECTVKGTITCDCRCRVPPKGKK